MQKAVLPASAQQPENIEDPANTNYAKARIYNIFPGIARYLKPNERIAHLIRVRCGMIEIEAFPFKGTVYFSTALRDNLRIPDQLQVHRSLFYDRVHISHELEFIREIRGQVGYPECIGAADIFPFIKDT